MVSKTVIGTGSFIVLQEAAFPSSAAGNVSSGKIEYTDLLATRTPQQTRTGNDIL